MMFDALTHIAFIGPGGPEFLVIMLVLLLMFGAKDAPRIFRKMNELLNQVRNTADSFKREVMYGDLTKDTPATHDHSSYDTEDEHSDEYDYKDEYYDDEDYSDKEEAEQDDSDETFRELEKDLKEELKPDTAEPAAESKSEDEDADAPKT